MILGHMASGHGFWWQAEVVLGHLDVLVPQEVESREGLEPFRLRSLT